jgi:hypothetical protein
VCDSERGRPRFLLLTQALRLASKSLLAAARYPVVDERQEFPVEGGIGRAWPESRVDGEALGERDERGGEGLGGKSERDARFLVAGPQGFREGLGEGLLATLVALANRR